jgi:hypothetical protein
MVKLFYARLKIIDRIKEENGEENGDVSIYLFFMTDG